MILCVPYSRWLQSAFFFLVFLLETESLSQWNIYTSCSLSQISGLDPEVVFPFIFIYLFIFFFGIAPASGKIQVYRFKIVHSVFLACFSHFLFMHSSYGASSFGGLGVSVPAEAVGFLGWKNPQHALLRRGNKDPKMAWKLSFRLNLPDNILAILGSLASSRLGGEGWNV